MSASTKARPRATQNRPGTETCLWCGEDIESRAVEAGAYAGDPAWASWVPAVKDFADYGCEASPETCEEGGVGSHYSIRQARKALPALIYAAQAVEGEHTMKCIDCGATYAPDEDRWAGTKHCDECGSDAYRSAVGILTNALGLSGRLEERREPGRADR